MFNNCKVAFLSTGNFFLLISLIEGYTPVYAESGAALEEVVVTARKREERIQDIPGSLSLFSADRIEKSGINELDDIQHSTPGFAKTGPDNGNAQLVMRGISAPSVSSGFSLPIGFLIDGVDQGGTAFIFNQELIDVERIEISRGPQGTIYGKNTIAGAINVITKAPTNEPEGFLKLEGGNFDLVNLQTGISGPIIKDQLAGRIAIYKRERNGFVENVNTGDSVNDQDVLGGRGKLRFTPTESLTVDLSLDYQRERRNFAYHEIIADTPGGINHAPYIVPGLLTISHSADTDFESTNIWGASLHATQEFDNGWQFQSITGTRHGDNSQVEDTDHTPLDNQTFSHDKRIDQLTQEFRISSAIANGSDIMRDYMLGLYFLSSDYDEHMGYRFGVDSGLIPEQNDTSANITTRQAAIFADTNWYITPRLVTHLGVRFSYERKELEYIEEGFPVNGNTVPVPFTEKSFSDVGIEPTATLTFSLTDDVNLYGKYTRGFKSGSFDTVIFKTPTTIQDAAFEEETVDAYEVGLKGTIFGSRLGFGIAGYFMDYQDLQIEILTPPAGPGLPPVRNKGAASADIYGVEVETTFRPIEELYLDGGFAYNVSKFKDDVPVFGGNTLINSPRWTAYANATYERSTSYGSAFIRGEWTYRSTWFSMPTNLPNEKPEGYSLVNARLGTTFDKYGIEASLWAKNLLDETYSTENWNIIGGQRRGFHEPRTFGGGLTYRF